MSDEFASCVLQIADVSFATLRQFSRDPAESRKTGARAGEGADMYPLRLVHDLRPILPWTVYELPVDIPGGAQPQPHARRFGVQWDEDNDERVLGAVLEAYFRHQESIWTLFAVAERKAALTVWTQELTAPRRDAWRAATNSLVIADVWDLEVVDAYDEVARVTGIGTLQLLKDGHRTRHFPPAYDQLNALIDLFELGPTGTRRPWIWTSP
jgi:hypothetical protein